MQTANLYGILQSSYIYLAFFVDHLVINLIKFQTFGEN